ncbi:MULTISPECIES: glycosyltransferase family 9 protein [unclassified Caballeronia]|uniref:glycosyltransferase family 9 protein n=1 Tax=unclassified Caballeronia TaxID=2646786 RepID=UPI00202801CA|nr:MULTISPECIES: glycosyltransferase family 9 protein [unclassified Caballeronia]
MEKDRAWADERMAQGLRYGAADQDDLALQSFLEVLTHDPDYPRINKNCGLALEKLGHTRAALLHYQRAVALDPVDTDLLAWIHRGCRDLFSQALAAYCADTLAVAESLCRELLEIDVRDFNAWTLLGQILLQKGYPVRARMHRHLAMAIQSRDPVYFDEAVRTASCDGPLCLELARALNRLGVLDAAEAAYQLALAAGPYHAQAYVELGLIQQRSARFFDAQTQFASAVNLNPCAENYDLLAQAMELSGRFEGALATYLEALDRNPENIPCHVRYGYALLRLGYWAEGWHRLQRMFSKRGLAAYGGAWLLRTSCPLLEDLQQVRDKSIAVVNWGRLSDTIMFSQLAQHLEHSGAARVEFIFTKEQYSEGDACLHARNVWDYPASIVSEPSELDKYDAWIPVMSLPALLQIDSSFRARGPYLFADTQLRAQWRHRLSCSAGRLKVGLAWSGDAKNFYDGNRSIPVAALFDELLTTSEVDWYVIQRNERNQDLSAHHHARIFDFSAELTTLDDCAALIAELDLVISVDSAPAHIAAALGKPVWLLLSAAGDWRWGRPHRVIHWYDSMTRYRQHKLGEWTELLRRVSRELRHLCDASLKEDSVSVPSASS